MDIYLNNKCVVLPPYDSELDFGWCRRPADAVTFFVSFDDEEVDGSFEFWRSWYSWKHGTMHKFVWHSGQWYLVFRRNIRPCASIVFQQKLQPNAGPGRITGQCWERFSNEISRNKCCIMYFVYKQKAEYLMMNQISWSSRMLEMNVYVNEKNTNLWWRDGTLQFFGSDSHWRLW